MNVTIPLGAAAVCFIISFIAFHGKENGLGWLFLLVGLAVVVIGVLLTRGSRKQ
jgi:1,4-dihydroxy-2-naphthoate octaprenyltransferase